MRFTGSDLGASMSITGRAQWRNSAAALARCSSVSALLALAACATDPPRDPAADLRANQMAGSNRPDAVAAPGQKVDEQQIAVWLRTLDTTDELAYSTALTRLRWTAGAVLDALQHHPLPTTVRGKRAVFELIMAAPPDETRDAGRFARLHVALAAIATAPGAASGPGAAATGEAPDALELRLLAFGWLNRLVAGGDATVAATCLSDVSRHMRWAAAGYFRGQPAKMTAETLDSVIPRLIADDPNVRADAAQVLCDYELALASLTAPAGTEWLTADPQAPAEERQRNMEAWQRWRVAAAPRITRLAAETAAERRAAKKPEKAAPEGTDPGRKDD
jgi:hypothetical protein